MCGREFRPPLRDLDEVRCAQHRAPAAPATPVEGDMVAAVRAELVRCGAEGSIEGMVALRLALTLDDPGLPAAQVSTLSQQLLRTMEPIRKRAPRQPDLLDELSARIARKAAAS